MKDDVSTPPHRVLPILPSMLIELAIGDLVKCEADKGYAIAMSDWHVGGAVLCGVCLAGSVMAQTLGRDSRETCTPSGLRRCGLLSSSDEKRLNALDSFRTGLVDEGLYEMGFEVPLELDLDDYSCVREYWEYPAGFKEDMLSIAEDLRRLGL